MTDTPEIPDEDESSDEDEDTGYNSHEAVDDRMP